jgi:hypothetical protein
MERYWKAVEKTKTKGIYRTGGIGGSKETLFKVGETYKVNGEPVLCDNGFHFYTQDNFIFGTKLFGDNTVFLEIEPLSKIIQDTEKCVCSEIKVLRYIPQKEWKRKIKKDYNSGNYNSGDCNSGDFNSGDYNSGYRNSGDRNSGYYNSGDRNSGDYNSGDYNSGYRNSGNYNSGDYNSGNYNSGDYNSGNYNSGDYNSGNGYLNYFCTQTRYFLFDLEVSRETIEQFTKIPIYEWFSLENKTYYEAWKECPDKHLEMFAKIAEFQTAEAREKFKEITGRDLPIKVKD